MAGLLRSSFGRRLSSTDILFTWGFSSQQAKDPMMTGRAQVNALVPNINKDAPPPAWQMYALPNKPSVGNTQIVQKFFKGAFEFEILYPAPHPASPEEQARQQGLTATYLLFVIDRQPQASVCFEVELMVREIFERFKATLERRRRALNEGGRDAELMDEEIRE